MQGILSSIHMDRVMREDGFVDAVLRTRQAVAAVRDADMNTREARRYLRGLVRFLGERAVSQQLERLRRESLVEQRNPHYCRYWLHPRRAWWRGLGEALQLDRDGLSLRHRVSADVLLALDSAIKIAKLYQGMPLYKREEYRTRLLADLDPTPVLLEIDLAAHYAIGGSRIEWCKSGSKEGRRTPEFVVVDQGVEIEIECRAKTINAGRKVARENFHRLVDEIDEPLMKTGVSGWIDITVPGAMSAKPAWRAEVCRAAVDRSAWSAGGATLSDGTRVDMALCSDRLVLARVEHLEQESTRLLHEVAFAHVALIAPPRGGQPSNPVFIRARSAQPDRILRNIFDDLRDKKDQFSGARAAVLCCYLPEVESFSTLTTGKLANMTLEFFMEHAPPAVAGVVYCSDADVVVEQLTDGKARSRQAPSLSFQNPQYDSDRFGLVRLPG